MRLGVFGGSFDPIHYAHLLLAETAYEKMNLDRVEFMPLGVPPHLKRLRSSNEDRYNMTVCAVSPYSEFTVNRHELESNKTSYTFESLEYYREQFPNDELFLIVSSETFNDIPNWKEPKRICELASLIIAQRCGYPLPDFDAFLAFATPERIGEFRKQIVETPLMELSSTYIRKRVAAGESVRFLTPDPVIDYIYEKRLYADN